MKETWRWYGETFDKITLEEIRQNGASGIVTALHDMPSLTPGQCSMDYGQWADKPLTIDHC